jgi:hypothetical protein
MIQRSNTTTLLNQSDEAFARELPTLLSDHFRKWVGYHGTERVSIERTKAEAYAACRRRGLEDEEFLVRCIEEPLDEDLVIGPDAA